MTAPTPSLPVFNTGDVLTQTSMGGITANLTNLYNFVMGGFRTLKPLCIVRKTTNQSIPNATNTAINFDIDDVDYDNMWQAADKSHVKINTAGVYDLSGQYTTAGSASQIGVYITVNGTAPTTDAVAANAPNATQASCAMKVALAVGATVSLVVIQNTGSAQNTIQTFGGTRLAAEWISP